MPRETETTYKRTRLRPPSDFDPKSFRTIQAGTHRIVVACPKGRYEGGRCQVPMVSQAILHPKDEPNPCPFCFLFRLGKG